MTKTISPFLSKETSRKSVSVRTVFRLRYFHAHGSQLLKYSLRFPVLLIYFGHAAKLLFVVAPYLFNALTASPVKSIKIG